MNCLKNPKITFPLIVIFSMVVASFPRFSVQAQSSTLTINPVADAYVSQTQPGSNYGTKTSLRVDNSPVQRGYLRFNVTGLNGGIIQSAKLQIYANSKNSSGYAVNQVGDNTWTETGVNFKNAPVVGTTINKASGFSAGTWTEVDVTPYIRGEGVYSFAVTGVNSTAINLASRENAANSPRIYLSLIFNSPTPTPTTPPASPNNPIPVGVGGTWNLRFRDEFDSGSLDLSKWRPNWFGTSDTAKTKDANGAMTNCIDPANTSVLGSAEGASGVVRMSLTNANGACPNGKSYKSGMIQTYNHFTPTYGFYEARIWFPVNSSNQIYNWPTWWLDTTGSWPQGGEIDIMEGLGGKPCATYHWGSGSTDVVPMPTICPSTPSNRSGWHTYGVDWEKGSLKYYYDGVQIASTTSNVTSSPQFLILSYSTSAQNNWGGPPSIPNNMYVDYVRAWQH